WIDGRHLKKYDPKEGYQIVQLGGDAYRIGLGGASGSSKTLGSQAAELDWNSVQRANAEMEKVYDRVIQACIMMGDDNPIKSIHDLGAGGDSNAVTEIIYPAGGKIYLRRIPCGDKSMSVMELWCNESQERVVLLVSKEDLPVIERIATREKCPMAVIGEISGDGKQVIVDEAAPPDAPEHEKEPVNLDLSFVLGKIPQMVIKDNSAQRKLSSLNLPGGTTVKDTLDRVLRLLKVSSKNFLVNHVDRSVTGFIAQQQCAGPLQLPVADVAVIADSYFASTGRCWALGDQPMKWIVDSEASVRMAAGEALTNLVWAQIEEFDGISLLGNWGVAASEPGEGDRLYRANDSLNKMLDKLGISINGGKDSMSMAAKVERNGASGMAKAPGTLVITAYASCKDVAKTVTPDIKLPGNSKLMLIDLSGGKRRTGGSALAQVFNQVGDQSPSVDDPRLLKSGFEAVQQLIADDLILSGHDVSDGGLVTCLCEMAFAGNCGLGIEIDARNNISAIDYLFAEELGLVIEYTPGHEDKIKDVLKDHNLVECSHVIGSTTVDKQINFVYGGTNVLSKDMCVLRSVWQETSYQIEKLQSNPKCAESEFKAGYDRPGLNFNLSFTPTPTPEAKLKSSTKPKIAILREEGVNGDREMAGAFYSAGFEPWDVTMTDLSQGRIGLDSFRGIAFCGGFAYADVLDSGKGWAAGVLFNDMVKRQFDAFYQRQDTFSLGVCNGCQVMAFLGWVPWPGLDVKQQPRFVLNESEMFESRFIAVKIQKSPSIMLEGMEGSVLGVSVAHGEGRFYCTDESIFEEIERQNLTPLRFVDDNGELTETYPANPNGSRQGITALCSPDGRHLAVMPHPERFFTPWQWSYWPQQWAGLKASPWLKIFQNARQWCEK
ncbi:phosphoribosylformylglycinamidine synthase, partial [Chloroflexota bacterium]